jgi:hypothetical protein
MQARRAPCRQSLRQVPQRRRYQRALVHARPDAERPACLLGKLREYLGILLGCHVREVEVQLGTLLRRVQATLSVRLQVVEQPSQPAAHQLLIGGTIRWLAALEPEGAGPGEVGAERLARLQHGGHGRHTLRRDRPVVPVGQLVGGPAVLEAKSRVSASAAPPPWGRPA